MIEKLRTLLRTLTNLVAVACLFVFSSYGVKHGYDVGGTVGKVSRARDWSLMDVHGVGILKDRKTTGERDLKINYRHL